MAVGVAAGIYRDYKEAARNMVHISPPVFPSIEDVALYKPKYKKYTAVCEALDTVWHRFEV
jgi:L-xylulokinase